MHLKTRGINTLYGTKFLTPKILFDDKNKEILEIARKAKEKYPEKIDFMYTLINHWTSRVAIYDNMAIDIKKLLPTNRKEPSYIGTIYLQKDCIECAKTNFYADWNSGIKIEDLKDP